MNEIGATLQRIGGRYEMTDPLYAVSPLDGRYAGRTEALAPYVSEAALLRGRTQVEIEYIIALGKLPETPFSLDDAEIATLRSVYESFDRDDAATIKAIETTGTADRPATNHDVKAVEYFVRDNLPGSLDIDEWVHFGLTSEDVNNLAYRILIAEAVDEVLSPAVAAVTNDLRSLAREYRDVPMLAFTHGQPATPTTFGKELAVYVSRLDHGHDRLLTARTALAGKLSGATGTYAAHTIAYPDVDWRQFSANFVAELGLEHTPLSTQINPCDDLAVLFDAFRRINTILIDLDRDIWSYIGKDYLGQQVESGETGSSTMPHKVNPIDFENSEGNLSKANADLAFVGDYITTSRMQRDLSDSTVKRTIGGGFAHCLLGYSKARDGLAKIVPRKEVMAEDLAANPAVLGEAIQTVLRREGHKDAYEMVKNATRGQEITIDRLRSLIADVDLPTETRTRLQDLEPATYIGLASELVDEIETDT